MTQPYITALICTRNGARMIQETLRSLLAQTDIAPEAYEIIVADNGSTDGTAQLAQETLAGQGVGWHVLSEPRPGKIHAQYRGIRAAKGEVIVIADDDNILCPTFLARVRKIFQDNPDVGMSGSHNRLAGVEAPEWFDSIAGRFACATVYAPHEALRVTSDGTEIHGYAAPAGAGSAFRRAPVLDAMDLGFFFFSCQHYTSLPYILGEDMELAHVMHQMGWRFAVNDALTLDHWVDASRLTEAAAFKLSWQQATGSFAVDYLMLEQSVGLWSIHSSWLWMTASKFKRALRETMAFRQGARTFRDRFMLWGTWAAVWFHLKSFGRFRRLAQARALQPWRQLRADQYCAAPPATSHNLP